MDSSVLFTLQALVRGTNLLWGRLGSGALCMKSITAVDQCTVVLLILVAIFKVTMYSLRGAEFGRHAMLDMLQNS